jgi:GNAT superfamily N-acetyltransferase
MGKHLIKLVKEEAIKSFATREWGIVNRRFNFIPAKKFFFFGLFDDNKLRGYAKLFLLGGITEISILIIQDKYTNKGFGSELMSFIVDWAKKKKCRRIVLKTASPYKKTIEFYKKHGFKIDAVLPKYYYNCDWYYMGKDLK